jgi:hypothetical protein
VSILNGSGEEGQAAETAGELAQLGFNVANTGNASNQARSTTIRYGSDEQARAELLASYLVQPPTLVDDPSVSSVDVVLVTGADYAGTRSSPLPVDEASPPTSPPESAAEPVEPTC